MTRFLEYLHQHARHLKWLFFATLATFTAGDFFVTREKIHFIGDRLPGFWSLFGLLVCVVTVYFCKGLSRFWLGKEEDYYED